MLIYLLHIALAAILALVTFTLCRRVALPIVHKLISKTKTTWDDVLLDNRVLNRASWLVTGATLIFYKEYILRSVPALFGSETSSIQLATISGIIENVGLSLLIFAAMLTITAIADAAHNLYTASPKNKPIKGFVQIFKLLAYIAGTIVGFSVLIDKDPTVLITGLGAMTAVLLIVFKDTILSLVASVQIGSNDMLRVGDWLEMPSVGADGDVIDIALHTVKVQNWDKTISTIPTHKLITGSFKNWRGMSESGGRRIKRSISLDINSVRFLTDDEIQHLSKYSLLHDYLEEKLCSIAGLPAQDELADLEDEKPSSEPENQEITTEDTESTEDLVRADTTDETDSLSGENAEITDDSTENEKHAEASETDENGENLASPESANSDKPADEPGAEPIEPAAVDPNIIPHQRRLTNIGTFRAWLCAYLKSHPGIHDTEMTFLVRQLQGGPTGIPIECYIFTRTTNWIEYEAIQGDIFDHCYAILPEFGLSAFQQPTGADFQALRS